MGFFLFLIAVFLWVVLTPLNLGLVLVRYRKKGLKRVFNGYFTQTAIDIDRFGNRNFRTLWNATLIKPGAYRFGDERETISSVLGKNQLTGTLTRAGVWLAAFLDFVDKDHCFKSIVDLKECIKA